MPGRALTLNSAQYHERAVLRCGLGCSDTASPTAFYRPPQPHSVLQLHCPRGTFRESVARRPAAAPPASWFNRRL